MIWAGLVFGQSYAQSEFDHWQKLLSIEYDRKQRVCFLTLSHSIF